MIIVMMMMMMTMFLSRTGEGNKPQPDNHSAIQAGKLTNVKVMMMMIMMIMMMMIMMMSNVKDTSGLTIEGFQEFYDEACLAVLNNKYNDGIQWHDVPCYFRSH